MTIHVALPPAPPESLLTRWRRQPYRLLFPLGIALVWAGVLPWLLFAAGALRQYRAVFHPIAQVEGFLTCFVAGFLLTMIPRRSGTAPPNVLELLALAGLPVLSTVAAWLQNGVVAHASWIAAIVVLLQFGMRRFLGGGASRRPPTTFVWLPIALVTGLVGASFALLEELGVATDPWWSLFARLLLLQGLMLGLIVGVGGMVLPLITRGEAPPDAAPGAWRPLAGHLLAAAALLATFAVEAAGADVLGRALRAAVVTALLLGPIALYRVPSRPGWHRWLVWLSGWAIPFGYALAAALPLRAQLGLHVVFVGGFALMALAVGAHVILAHGDRQDLVFGRPWQVPVLAAALLASIVLRGLVVLDPADMLLWLGAASATFLIATLLWLSLTWPGLRRAPAE